MSNSIELQLEHNKTCNHSYYYYKKTTDGSVIKELFAVEPNQTKGRITRSFKTEENGKRFELDGIIFSEQDANIEKNTRPFVVKNDKLALHW